MTTRLHLSYTRLYIAIFDFATPTISSQCPHYSILCTQADQCQNLHVLGANAEVEEAPAAKTAAAASIVLRLNIMVLDIVVGVE